MKTPMPPGRRLAIASLSLLMVLAIAPGADDPPDSRGGHSRLALMPPARRRALAANLERFDTLPAAEQAALRELDRALADQPAIDRERYLATARTYHLWVQSLPEEKRRALADAPPDRRLDLVRQFREEQRREVKVPAFPDWLQVSSLNPIPLFVEAFQLKVWSRLTPEERKDLERVRDPDQRTRRIQEYGQQLQVGREFRHVREEFQQELARVQEGLGMANPPKKAIAINRLQKAQGRADQLRRRVEAAFLRDREPSPVEPSRLSRFEAELPSWIRDALDPLPPDAARRRLHVLYRMVYPPGGEIDQAEPSRAGGPGGAP